MVEIGFDGAVYDCRESETVLLALVRQGVDLPYSCRKGACLTCMLRAVEGEVPPVAQDGLKDTLRLQGYFLPCVCTPEQPLELTRPDEAQTFGRITVVAVERLAPKIARVVLEPATPLYYRAGQFINLRRADGLSRSYSLASVPRLDRHLAVHVKRLPGGRMSSWIFDELEPGGRLDFQGPNGSCFYVSGDPSQGLLLICNGSGLGSLLAIARDALKDGHSGPVHLYHGTRHPEGLYLRDEIEVLAAEHDNFTYVPCVSGPRFPPECRAGRADVVALAERPDLTGWRIYLCGYAPMGHGAKKMAYLAGATPSDIYADAFELQDLRREPRD